MIAIRRAVREVEESRGGGTLTNCRNCHQRHPSVRLYRIPFVGLRPLCEPCREALDAMGYGTETPA